MLRKLREEHGRFYVYPMFERFEVRDKAQRAFTRAGAERLAKRLNWGSDSTTFSIGYWSMDGSEGWYPRWLGFLDRIYCSFGPVAFFVLMAIQITVLVQFGVLVWLFFLS